MSKLMEFANLSVTQSVITAGLGLFIGWWLRDKFSKSDVNNTTVPQTKSRSNSFDDYRGDFKMVLVVRSDLGMGKGKAAAQTSHAAVGCYKKATKKQISSLRKWESNGQPKVVVKTDGEDAIYELAQMAENLGLISCVIHDAGRTQIAAGSTTVVGIGPGPATLVDKVTGHLKLF